MKSPMDQTTTNTLIIRRSLVKPSLASDSQLGKLPLASTVTNCGLCQVLLQICFPKGLRSMQYGDVMSSRNSSQNRKPSGYVGICQGVLLVVAAGVRSTQNRHRPLVARSCFLTFSLKKWLILGQGKDIHKMSLEHLLRQKVRNNFKITELNSIRVYPRHREANGKSSQ